MVHSEHVHYRRRACTHTTAPPRTAQPRFVELAPAGKRPELCLFAKGTLYTSETRLSPALGMDTPRDGGVAPGGAACGALPHRARGEARGMRPPALGAASCHLSEPPSPLLPAGKSSGRHGRGARGDADGPGPRCGVPQPCRGPGVRGSGAEQVRTLAPWPRRAGAAGSGARDAPRVCKAAGGDPLPKGGRHGAPGQSWLTGGQEGLGAVWAPAEFRSQW